MRLAVDYDRVIHDIDNPTTGMRMGPPIEGAVEALHTLRDEGHALFVHTTRARQPNLTYLRNWLYNHDLGFLAWQVTATKPDVDHYIDDKALRFESWAQTLGALR